MAVRRATVFNSSPSGNKLVSILNRMGTKFVSKFKKKRWWSSPSCSNWFRICMLPLCRLQLLSRPRVFTVLNFDQVHMPLVYIQLVGLPHAFNTTDHDWMLLKMYDLSFPTDAIDTVKNL
eukprot:1152109-Pelagomonas_calceolata.AAC.2